MNAKDLSKCKYIYRVYVNRDKVTHVEKHPIIYANKMYIYFKDGKGCDLKRISTKDVLTRDPASSNIKINSALSNYRFYGRPWNSVPVELYIWDENGIDMDDVNDVYERLDAAFKKQRIDQKIAEVNRLKARHEAELKELERLTKEMEG